MAPKRRLSSNESSPVKKTKSQVFTHTPEEYKDFFSSTLNLVFHLKDGDEELAPVFIKLPSKKFYPDYYHTIKQPVSLNEIQKRIRGKYTGESADEFIEDFELLLANAKTYNPPDSWIITCAEKIVDFVKDQVKEFENTPSTETETIKKPKIKLKLKQKPEPEIKQEPVSLPTTPAATSNIPTITFGKLPELCIEVLMDVINHEFPDFGVISDPFLDEVDTDFYTDYLDYVTKPMAFNTILGNLEKKKLLSPKFPLLDNLKKFHDTTSLIFENAKAYNDEGSQIYQDAVLLEEYFNTKYNELKTKVEKSDPKSHVKQLTPKLKLNLNRAAATIGAPRGRKKKITTLIQEAHDDDDIEEDNADEETNEVDTETPAPSHPGESVNVKDIVAEQSTANTMGKTLPLLPENNAIIQESAIFSSPAVSTNVTKFVNQKLSAPATILPRDQEIKKSLFPTQQENSIASLFSYKVPSNGYTTQSYTIALPNGVSPFVSFKVSLHHLLYQVKKRDLVDGHGYLNQPASEDFQCKLLVNDEEVASVVDCFKEKNGKEDILGVQYDVRLSYGLNVLTFDCKVAPALSKKIKNTVIKEEEVAGRHTRHQLQQLQKTWDVETITFYVVCNSG